MGCYLTRNILHSGEYNSGGISGILLLDVRHFDSYRFKSDGLFDTCFVEAVRVSSSLGYNYISVTDETEFSETCTDGIYTQELQTFVRGQEAGKTSGLLLASNNRYVVIFTTYSGRAFTFGSDGGAKAVFSQTSGLYTQTPGGYSVTLTKQSVFPLFEFDLSAQKLYTYNLHDKYFEPKYN